MEEYYILVLCHFEKIHGYFVGCKQLYSFGKFGFFTHGNPYVGIYGICALDCFKVGRVLYNCSGLFGYFLHLRHELFIWLKFLWSYGHIVHSKFGSAYHKSIAHIVSGIPYESKLHFIQWFEDIFHHGEEVCKNLCGMILVGQTVPYRNTAVLSKLLNNLLRETSEFNTVKHSAKNPCCILYSFLMSELYIIFSQIFRMSTFINTTYHKRTSCSCRWFLKYKRYVFINKILLKYSFSLLFL
ncbi:hypothetical protein SDC9_102232 [bioreactor metagenome]|uniref:Uncharacterized protein n=1 Tax=bioreactor metagenome TaxID=1076179 RepID=A0A645AQ89_9ZZZZ